MTKNKKRIVALLFAAMFCFMAPSAAIAQQDGFSSSSESVDGVDINGIWGTYNITDYETDEILPLGNGLAILVAAGAGYTLLKRRKGGQKENDKNN